MMLLVTLLNIVLIVAPIHAMSYNLNIQVGVGGDTSQNWTYNENSYTELERTRGSFWRKEGGGNEIWRKKEKYGGSNQFAWVHIDNVHDGKQTPHEGVPGIVKKLYQALALKKNADGLCANGMDRCEAIAKIKCVTCQRKFCKNHTPQKIGLFNMKRQCTGCENTPKGLNDRRLCANKCNDLFKSDMCRKTLHRKIKWFGMFRHGFRCKKCPYRFCKGCSIVNFDDSKSNICHGCNLQELYDIYKEMVRGNGRQADYQIPSSTDWISEALLDRVDANRGLSHIARLVAAGRNFLRKQGFCGYSPWFIYWNNMSEKEKQKYGLERRRRLMDRLSC